MRKEKPIIFSGPMVRAILEGRKTQTRLVMKPQPPKNTDSIEQDTVFLDEWIPWVDGERHKSIVSPYRIGDILWVKETWRVCGGTEKHIDYRATPIIPKPNDNWRQSIFMPREFSRITLEIVDVRAERLQEIRAEGCIAEGLTTQLMEHEAICSLKDQYKQFWDSIHGKKHPWESNPFVWVREFKRIYYR